MRDLTGAFDDDGNPIADGAPDNPASIMVSTDENWTERNYNLSVGVSATWSRPQDKKLQHFVRKQQNHDRYAASTYCQQAVGF